nr:molecular chaperone DnaJ [Verrucomicrobium sp. GAS474]
MFREVFGGGFDDAFGGGGGGGRSSRGRGSDLRYDLEISFEEAARGCEKEINFHKLDTCPQCDGSGAEPGSKITTCATCAGHGQVTVRAGFIQMAQTCPRCRGTGKTIEKSCTRCKGEGRVKHKASINVRIPAGIDDGTRLRSAGHGEGGVNGGPSGDLLVVVHVREHELFKRDGADLFCDVPISFARATLGGDLEVPTLDGKAIVKIPAGSQHGRLFRLKGKGLPDLRSRTPGDLHVRILIEVPTSLNIEQRELLQAFATSCDERIHPQQESFVKKAKRFFS